MSSTHFPHRTQVPHSTRSRRVALEVEVLEDRTLPSAALVSNLVVFGDSLDDVGNLSRITGGALPPGDIYYQGRFSNGPLWADTLAEYLGAPPVKPSLDGGLDYAFA